MYQICTTLFYSKTKVSIKFTIHLSLRTNATNLLLLLNLKQRIRLTTLVYVAKTSYSKS